MDLAELIAREQIRDTVASYTHAGDSGRIGELAELFLPDGVLEVVGRQTVRGRDAIREYLGGTSERNSRPGGEGPGIVRHNVSNVRIRMLSPTEAEVVCYFVVFNKREVDHWGRYRDRIVDDGDRWRFAHRTVRLDTTPTWHEPR